jgi:hypothetical protein
MNLPRRAMLLGQDAPYTPPFQPAETFPVSREHELPEQHVEGDGPWTYAMLLAAALGIYYVASK